MDLGGPRSAQIRIFIVFLLFFLQILGCVGPAVGPAGSARVGPAASAWPRRPASARVGLCRPVSARVGPRLPGYVSPAASAPCRPGRVGPAASARLCLPLSAGSHRPACVLSSAQLPLARFRHATSACLSAARRMLPAHRPSPHSRTLKSRTPEISNSETIPYSDRLKTWSDSLW